MGNSLNKITKKLSSWIINSSKIQQSNSLFKILALFKLINLVDKKLTVETLNFLHQFMDDNEQINYCSDSIFNSLLASSLILDIGSEKQIESAKEYLSILQEVKDSVENYSTNTTLLDCAFNDDNNDNSYKIDIEIPMFDLDILKMIDAVINQIEIKSKFGKLEINYDFVFNSKIEGMTIHAIRSYDFELAMRCLRALKYLKVGESLAIKTGLDFIMNQQCTDGSFGDFETAFSEVNKEGMGENSLLEIKLEIAIQVLWTVYELLSDKNNLMSQLFNVQRKLKQRNRRNHVN
jgi:prenyltransferase beta subunit